MERELKETVWDVKVSEDKTECHIIPRADIKEHIESKDCWCNPTIDYEETEDGLDAIIYVHNSLDRRELYENTTH